MAQGKPMEIPSSALIGGEKWRIVWTDLGDDYGQTKTDLKTIQVGTRCAGSRKETMETLRHEMLHASFSVSGVSHLEMFEEEAVVRCIENIFFPAWERMQKRLNHENKK
jgi:hypothetical protein